MKVRLICIFIYASLCVMIATATPAVINESKHDDGVDKAEVGLRQKETKDGGSSNEKNAYAQLRSGIAWHKHHKRHDTSVRRHQRIIYNGRKACSTKRSFLFEATDEFGDRVQIAPFIGDKGKVRQQFIFETHCAKENCDCHGVDDLFYESACVTNYMMVYARVIKAGKMNWDSVKVQAGCNCIVREKKFSHMIEAV